MIKLCEKISIKIKEYTEESINEILNMCENCQYYYYCDEVLKLNDILKGLENDKQH